MKRREIVLISLVVILLYFVQKLYIAMPLNLIGIDPSTLSVHFKAIYSLCYELVFILILIAIYHKIFKDNFKDYIHNFKKYVKEYIDYWALAFGLMILSNIFIGILTPNAISTNQEAINQIFSITPLYIIVSAVLYAPIIEETVFRLSIRNIIKNNTLFIIVSGLFFGLLHVIGSGNIVNFIYIIPYSIPGCVFAYTLVKSQNIFVPISLHLFHNSISMLLQIILGILV